LNPLDTAQHPSDLHRELLEQPDALLRDRLWALKAPALMRSAVPDLASLLGETTRFQPPLPPPRHRRLGLYFEDLVAECLQMADTLYRNIQCRRNGLTLGEFDFVYRRNGRWHHLETAVKFYLCLGDGGELAHFVGPGLRDRLDIKWQRLQQHQLQLSQSPAGRDTLAGLGATAPVVELLMPGYLFYHIAADVPPLLHPAISPAHLRGFWCTGSEMRARSPQAATRYVILPKLRWLVPARVCTDDSLEPDQLLEKLELQTQPVLVSELTPSGAGDDWIERKRGFVVPDSWPERAVSASARDAQGG